MSAPTKAETKDDGLRDRIVHKAREIEALVQTDVPPPQFFDEFLNLLVEALAARAGAVWMLDRENRLHLATDVRLLESGFNDNHDAHPKNERLLRDVLATGEAAVYAPGDDSGVALPTRYVMVLAAIQADNKCIGVVQLLLRPDSPVEVRSGYLQYVEQMCGFASQFLAKRKTAASAPTAVEFFKGFEHFVLNLQRANDVRETASTAANDGRLLLEADRASVAYRRGRKTAVKAISGQDSVNPRANLVRSMVRMCDLVMAMREPVIFTGKVENLAPKVEEALAEYVQESGSRMVMFLPLFESEALVKPEDDPKGRKPPPRRKKAIGCLVVEQVNNSQVGPGGVDRAKMIADHVGASLSKARSYERVFGLPVWRAGGVVLEWFHGRKLAKTFAVLMVVGAVAAALVLIPWDYRVEGEGKLMPSRQARVFCPWDGKVMEVYVEDGDKVVVGQPLAKLRNEELIVEITQKKNEYNEAEKRLLALQAEIDEAARNDDEEKEIRAQGEYQKTEIEIGGLIEEVRLLEQRKESLVVKSPIDGEISTFQVKQLLLNRPVSRGEVMMEVMDPTGPWRLEVAVEEHRMGHLLRAFERRRAELKEAGEDEQPRLPVEYILATYTEATYNGVLNRPDVATRPVTEPEVGSTVEVLVEIDVDALPDPRIGAEVRSKIDCGKRSLGYVLFGDVVEFVRKYLWL